MKIEFVLIDDDGKSYRGSAELTTATPPIARAREVRAARRAEPTALPDHVLALREAGFFREPRTASEVHAKLQETYHCLLNRVQMALLRLLKKRELRKAIKKTNDREQTGYVW